MMVDNGDLAVFAGFCMLVFVAGAGFSAMILTLRYEARIDDLYDMLHRAKRAEKEARERLFENFREVRDANTGAQ